MSATDRGRMSYLRQADPLLIPTTPTWQIARITSGTMAYQKTVVESAELDASANPTGSVKTGAKSAGSISVEWSAGTFDGFLEAALRGTFGNTINDTGAHVITAASRNVQATGAFVDAAVGQWILLSGFVVNESFAGAGDSPNNGWFVIDVVTDDNNVVVLDPGARLVNETGPVTAVVKSQRLLNGTRKIPYAVEEGLLDVGSFFAFLGQYVSTLSMNLTAGQIVTGEIAFMGSGAEEEQVDIAHTGVVTVTATTRTIVATGAFADAVVGQTITIAGMAEAGNNVTGEIATNADDNTVTLTAATSTLVDETGPATATITAGNPSWSAGGTYTIAGTDQPLNATNNIGDIVLDGAISTSCYRSLTFTINNNLRETACVGEEFPRIDFGTPSLTGSFEKLFANPDLWRAMRDHDVVAIEFGFIADGGAAGIHISIPAAYINTDTVDLSGGKNSDVYDKVDFTARRFTNDADETYYCQVCIA